MIPNRYENISGKRNKLETKLSRDVGNSFQLEDNSTLEQLEEEDRERGNNSDACIIPSATQ